MKSVIHRRAFLAGAAGLGSVALSARNGFAQQAWPARDITYVIPYAPGGMSDNISRLLSDKLGGMLGRQLLNDYRAGAGGAIGANYYMAQKPDGYSLLQATNSFFGVIPNVTKVEYDPKTDLTPLVLVGDAPMAIACNPAVPAKSLEEFVALAKKNPGKFAYGTSGHGTVGHLCGIWLAKRAGIEILHVPYRGASQALQSTLAGETQLFFGPEAAEQISGKVLTGLGVMGSERWSAMPDLPTTAESGLAGWAPRSWHTVVIHSKAPEEIRLKLAKMLNDILAMPEVKQRLIMFGLIPGFEDLAGMRKRADDDYAEFRVLLVEAGLALKK